MRSVNIYFVRHAETEANRLGIIQGQLNTPLNRTGLGQAQVLAERLKDVPFSHAFTSDLARTADTAAIVMQYHPSVELVRTSALRERYLGSRQGQPRGYKHSKAESEAMEPRDHFHARLWEWWEKNILPLCLSDSAATSSGSQASLVSEQPLRVLAVSHGASIAALVLTILVDQCRFPSLVNLNEGVYNTSIAEIQLRVGKDAKGVEWVSPVISRFGDIKHLLRPRERSGKKQVVVRANADLEESAREGDKRERKPRTADVTRGSTVA